MSPLTDKGPEHKILVVEEEVPITEACDFFNMMLIGKFYYHPITAVRHSGGSNMGMADGHVESLTPDDLPPATAWLTVGQGYALPAPAYHYYIDLRSTVNSPK